MGNEDRRGGIGFGNQRRSDAVPQRYEEDEDPPEATRALDVDDFPAPPTEFVKAPAPAGRAAPQRPAPMPQRPAPSPPVAARPRPAPMPPPEEEDQSTRMLDAVDYDPPAPQHRAQQVQLRPMELRIVSGPDRGKIHRLDEGASLVGRGLDCQIVLGDPAVSRKHFKIERSGDEAVLVDLGGANGTNVNGSKSARHVLEPGDHIEIGTSVLEFFIEGVAARRKAGGSPGGGGGGTIAERPMEDMRGQAPARPKQGGIGKIIAIAAAGLVVLGGGATAAFLLLKSKGGQKPAGTEEAAAAAQAGGQANPKLQKLLVSAKSSIADMDFSGAEDALKTAKGIEPDNTEIKELLKQVRKERDNQETLDDAKQLAKQGDFDTALKKFAEIDDKSVLHADAQDAMNAAREAYVSARLSDAKKAMDSGDNPAALKALETVLKVDPKRVEAKTMRDQLAAGAVAKPEEAKPAGDAKPAPDAKALAPVAKEAPAKEPVAREAAVKIAEPKAVDASPAGNKKADFGAGLAAYHSKQWSAAILAFDAIANGPYPKEAKAKAAGYSAAVKAASDAMNEAAAGGGATKQVNAYKAAYNADKRVDGSLGSFLAGKIAEAYVAKAKDALAKKQYYDAFEAAGEAQNFVPDKPDAQQIIEKCNTQAGVMLQQAKQHMDKKNYGEARDLARQVARILSASDPRAQEAQAIAKKASEANNQDDN